MSKSNYYIIEQTDEYILLCDVGPWDQYLTITNNIENVCIELSEILGNKELRYINSENELTIWSKDKGFN